MVLFISMNLYLFTTNLKEWIMITVNGVEYTEEQLNDTQKYLVAQVQDINTKIQKFQFDLDQLSASKEFMTARLMETFEEVNPDETIAESPAAEESSAEESVA